MEKSTRHYSFLINLGRKWIENCFFSLYHYGTKEHSGRYPYGSGKRPYQREGKLSEYEVEYKPTGEKFHFSEGAKLSDKHIMFGKGSKKPLNDEVKEGLSEQFGGNPEDWSHPKANSTIDYYGEDRPVEVHWFEANGVGKHKFKIKKWLDE